MLKKDCITIQNVIFEELTAKSMNELKYKQIMFVLNVGLGAMGYSGKTFLLIRRNSFINGYYIDAHSDIFPIFNHSFVLNKKIFKYWKYMNLGAGNKLYMRNNFANIFRYEYMSAYSKSILDVYSRWIIIANKILLTAPYTCNKLVWLCHIF